MTTTTPSQPSFVSSVTVSQIQQQQSPRHRHWPAEWDPHTACIVLWPHHPGTFRLDEAEPEFVGLVRALVLDAHETVWILCRDNAHVAHVTRLVEDIGRPVPGRLLEDKEHDRTSGIPATTARIECVVCPSHDTWARDTVPTFVLAKNESSSNQDTDNSDKYNDSNNDNNNNNNSVSLVALDFGFNAYGGPDEGCYWPCPLDQQIGARVCDLMTSTLLPALSASSSPTTKVAPPSLARDDLTSAIILEGGSIHTNGAGILLTTSECLLHPSRNPSLHQSTLTDILCAATGCHTILWLDAGLAGDDDTNGHIDNWACFATPTVVLLAWTDQTDTPWQAENYQRCRAARRQLLRHAAPSSLTVVPLRLPQHTLVYTAPHVAALAPYVDPHVCHGTTVAPRDHHDVMAASYINAYIGNDAILVPQFGDPHDGMALETWRSVRPDRTVVGVPSRAILGGGGNLHCVTQQVPSVSPWWWEKEKEDGDKNHNDDNDDDDGTRGQTIATEQR